MQKAPKSLTGEPNRPMPMPWDTPVAAVGLSAHGATYLPSPKILITPSPNPYRSTQKRREEAQGGTRRTPKDQSSKVALSLTYRAGALKPPSNLTEVVRAEPESEWPFSTVTEVFGWDALTE